MKNTSKRDNQFWSYIDRLSRAQRRSIQAAAAAERLNLLQSQILRFLQLNKHRSITVGFIADEMEVTEATVSDSLRVLSARKLIRKNQDSKDKRIRHITITAIGERALEKCRTDTPQYLSALPETMADNMLIGLQETIYQIFMSGSLHHARICRTCANYSMQTSQPYCALLKMPLRPIDLQFDCSDHQYSLS